MQRYKLEKSSLKRFVRVMILVVLVGSIAFAFEFLLRYASLTSNEIMLSVAIGIFILTTCFTMTLIFSVNLERQVK